MKTSLSEMIKQLEEQGIDTSKFSINIDGKDLSEFLELAKTNVEQGTVSHKTFRRWVLAQTWKMLNEPVYDPKDRTCKPGWERYMRLNYDYKYQFTMLLDELKVLEKMKKRNYHSEEYAIRKLFFTKDVVLATCKHALNAAKKNSYGYNAYFKNAIDNKIEEANRAYTVIWHSFNDDYHIMAVMLEKFINTGILNYISCKERKCQQWKDAYKAAGAYYSLQNMILYHDCALPILYHGYHVLPVNKKCDSYKTLNVITKDLATTGELWRLHNCLLDTIECNHFDLVKSINKRK